MTPTPCDPTLGQPDNAQADVADDPRLLRAVEEFLQQLEAGRRPDRHEYLRRFPDLAEPLGECLEGLELVHRTASAKKPAPGSAPGLASTAHEALPANPLGDFQILREIGRGGMGIVYEAVQLSLGRRVALKVLPLAATFDAKHLQRFRNEAQAAAQLHHTNIVPVYYVGCERGVNFYAMQLIDGHSLATVIDQLRRARDSQAVASAGPAQAIVPVADAPTVAQLPTRPGPPRTGAETMAQVSTALSAQRSSKREEYFRTAARFIVQAAEALEHAHQFGIVHRDIKPANLLVDTTGRIWITDFGLAQFHAGTALTLTGDIMGTLRYMSPEQASGQRAAVDQRTDVYSLGATLYELVTLEPIFSGQAQPELLQQIARDEPRAPTALDKNIPVDLETIILKAISKNPADRYASARDLAADLQRYLEFKPILAKRPSPIERARKWSRRHPAVLAAAAILLAFGVIGLAGMTLAISREQARTQAAYKREEQRANEAEARLRLAQRAADEMIEIGDQELANDPLHDNLRKRLLEAALNYYQEFIELRRDDPDAQAVLEATRDRVKKILGDLAVMQGAGRITLLKNPGVIDDLHASDEQRTHLAQFMDRFERQCEKMFRDSPRPKPDEWRKRLLEHATAYEAELASLLTPAQLARLGQIALQFQGPWAFRDPTIMTALKLTAAQRERIRSIEADVLFGGGDRPRGGPRDPGYFEKVAAASMQRIMALLTEEQLRLWRTMTGEPFKGSFMLRPHCPPGPLGPPPGPPGGPAGPPGGPPHF